MPKVATKYIELSEPIQLNYKVDINYKGGKFWAAMPPGFDDAWETITEAEKKKFHLSREYNRGYKTGSKLLIKADKEADVITFMTETIKGLSTRKLESRPVIIIDYDNETHSGWQTATLENVGFELAVYYCTELKVGKDKKYFLIRTERVHPLYPNDLETEEVREEIEIGKKFLIIDDTPANRVFLEELHEALKKLGETIRDITGDKDKLLEFIGTGQKLLR